MQTESPTTPKPGPKLPCQERVLEAGKQGQGLVKPMLLSLAELCSSPAYLGGLSRTQPTKHWFVATSLYHSQSKQEAPSVVSRHL